MGICMPIPVPYSWPNEGRVMSMQIREDVFEQRDVAAQKF